MGESIQRLQRRHMDFGFSDVPRVPDEIEVRVFSSTVPPSLRRMCGSVPFVASQLVRSQHELDTFDFEVT
jgi:hypothetical protein